VGLGGAFSSIDGDVSALEYNPAGLVNINRTDFLASYASYIEDTSLQSFSVGFPIRFDNLNLAVHYALRCLELANQFEQEMVSNPKIIFGGAALLAATAKYKQNKFTEVEALLDIAAKYYTEDDESIKEMRANVREAKRKHKLIGAFNALRESLEAEGKTAEVRTLATSAPSEIADAHEVARYVPKKRPTDKPTIAFLCGGGMAGGWGPELLKTGIGGSEEAVCYLAEQFVQKGWHVEVYAETKRQQWHGIEWYPTSHFSGDSDEGEVDALVVWRDATQLLHFGVKAKRTYLWLHDMPNPACWMPGLWDAFDGIFVLSNFHGEQHGFIPTEKKVLTGNGLPVDRLVPLDQLSNDPKRMIYASDPTRGLATVLEWWDFIREKVPGAELDVYYGFHPTLMAAANGRGPHARYLRSIIGRVNELKDQPGVNWKGFVGQDELHAGMAKCGLAQRAHGRILEERLHASVVHRLGPHLQRGSHHKPARTECAGGGWILSQEAARRARMGHQHIARHAADAPGWTTTAALHRHRIHLRRARGVRKDDHGVSGDRIHGGLQQARDGVGFLELGRLYRPKGWQQTLSQRGLVFLPALAGHGRRNLRRL
jgi:hypothetical protein